MSSFNFDIQGGNELDAALKKLGLDLERKISRSAVRSGATVIAKEARLLAPVSDDEEHKGTLKRSIKVVARSKRVGDAVASVVTRSGRKWRARKMDAWYAPMVEFGTKNMAARPFLRPALDAKSAEAIKRMSEVIQKRIAKLAQ